MSGKPEYEQYRARWEAYSPSVHNLICDFEPMPVGSNTQLSSPAYRVLALSSTSVIIVQCKINVAMQHNWVYIYPAAECS